MQLLLGLLTNHRSFDNVIIIELNHVFISGFSDWWEKSVQFKITVTYNLILYKLRYFEICRPAIRFLGINIGIVARVGEIF